MSSAGGLGTVRYGKSLFTRLRSKQGFNFGFCIAGPVKAAYIPRLRIKAFVVRVFPSKSGCC